MRGSLAKKTKPAFSPVSWLNHSKNEPFGAYTTIMIASSALNPAPIPTVPARNFGLDVIRATAIGLVLIAHYATVAPVCGVLGVELFFVLSGFLIGGILYRTIQSQEQLIFRDLARFWVRRWMRTLPNYYFFLGVLTVLATKTQDRVAWRIWWPHLLFLQNFVKPPAAFYGISWSLAIEEWFYLLFPLLFFVIYMLTGRRPETKRKMFLFSAVAMAVVSLGLRLWTGTSAGWASGMRMIVVYRFDALMLGVLISVVKIENQWWWKRLQAWSTLGAVLLAVGTVIAQRTLTEGESIISAAWLLTIIPMGFALILPRMTLLVSPRNLLATAVNYVSQASYSIYLCHLPILFFLMRVAHDARQGPAGKMLIRATALVLTLTCSGLLYRYLEQPILNLAPKDRFSPLRRRTVLTHEPTL